MSLLIKRYADLVGPYLFYQGTERLWFSPSKWVYVRETSEGLEELSGVTAVLHAAVDRSSSLMPWAVKQAMIRLRILAIERGLGPNDCLELFVSELDEIITAAKRADREILEDAGAVGHEAHAWIESLIKTTLAADTSRQLELLAKLPLDDRSANCCIASVDWQARHRVRWVATERRVFSRQYKFAGTLDGLAYVSSCDDPLCCPRPFHDRLSLIDHKTSNYLYTTYLMQTAAYWQAAVEETSEPIEDRWVLRYGKDDAEFEAWHAEGRDAFEQDFAAFLHALDLTRSLKAIDGRMGVIREARKEVRKAAAAAAREDRLALACEGSKRYKGVRPPKCGPTGTGCASCLQKYFENHQK